MPAFQWGACKLWWRLAQPVPACHAYKLPCGGQSSVNGIQPSTGGLSRCFPNLQALGGTCTACISMLCIWTLMWKTKQRQWHTTKHRRSVMLFLYNTLVLICRMSAHALNDAFTSLLVWSGMYSPACVERSFCGSQHNSLHVS